MTPTLTVTAAQLSDKVARPMVYLDDALAAVAAERAAWVVVAWVVRECTIATPMQSIEFSLANAQATQLRWAVDGYEGRIVELSERSNANMVRGPLDAPVVPLVAELDAMADGWLCAGLPDADLPRRAAREIERLTADRRVLQSTAAHPAPCARFCEATAFQIELRRRDADAALLAWVLAHPDTCAEVLEDAAAGEGEPRALLEQRRDALLRPNV